MVMFQNIVVHCDSEMCNESITLDKSSNADLAEKRIETLGWSNEGLKNYCPSCKKKVGIKIDITAASGMGKSTIAKLLSSVLSQHGIDHEINDNDYDESNINLSKCLEAISKQWKVQINTHQANKESLKHGLK